jgi:hypothetical protein
MKQYLKNILSNIQRAEQLQSINQIQQTRQQALSRNGNAHAKDMLRDQIESNRRLRAEHQKAKKTWK